MLNLWYTLFTALWSVELEKHCLFTRKGQAHNEEPDLTSWKRADLQPRDIIMKKKKMQQQEWRSATKCEERDLLFFGVIFFLIRKRTYAINSAGKGAA